MRPVELFSQAFNDNCVIHLQLIDEMGARLGKDMISKKKHPNCWNRQIHQPANVRQLAGQEDRPVELDHVHHRIQVIELLVPLGKVAGLVENWREKKKQVQQHTEQILRVAESNVESCREVGQAQGQNELKRNHGWQGENRTSYGTAAQHYQHEKNRKRHKKMNQLGCHRNHWENGRRETCAFNKFTVIDDRAGGLE